MKKKHISLVLSIAMILSAALGFSGCNKPKDPTSDHGVDFQGESFLSLVKTDPEQTLNMAVKYDDNSYMYYNQSATYAAANGQTYTNNTQNPMLKPVWEEMEKRMNIKIVNRSVTGNIAAQYNNAVTLEFENMDIINLSASQFIEEGVTNNRFIDIKPYLNRMPNLKAFLDANPFVANNITAAGGKMYYAPYFDGYDDLERMFIMRADWVEKLLDQTTEVGDTEAAAGLNVYTPFLAASLPAQTVKITNAAGTGTQDLNKLATANIITTLNGLSNPTGKSMIAAFKAYVTARYGNFYGATPSKLFTGQTAAYDADELVALLRLVKANPKYLTGKSTTTQAEIVPFFPRFNTNDRVADLFRLASIFGVRGTEGRNGNYLFVDENGVVQDARFQDDTMFGIKKLNEMYQEGLILQNFSEANATGATVTDGKLSGRVYGDNSFRGDLSAKNLGFMTYDYNQTTTVLNGLDGQASAIVGAPGTGFETIEGFNLTPVLPPFTVWKGKTYSNQTLTLPTTLNADNFYRFTESWRSVKPDGWGIVSTTEGKKLERALAMFDYMYSTEGNRLMSYGPDAWIANSNTDPAGGSTSQAKGTIKYLGRDVPKLATQAFTELMTYASGNYTNYYRRFLGGTMPIGYIKEQGMEYQCTHAKGQAGQQIINNAILTGTMKHLLVGEGYAETTDKTLRSMPTTLAYTEQQQTMISQNYKPFTDQFRITSTASEAGQNLIYNYIQNGFGDKTTGAHSPTNRLTWAALRDYIAKPANNGLNGEGHLLVVRAAYQGMTGYSQGL